MGGTIISDQFADLTKWLNESALERRYVSVIAAGFLAVLSLIATNQRSIFTPWQPGANPLVPPSAFFANPQLLPVGNRVGFAGRPARPGAGGGTIGGTPGVFGGPALATPGGNADVPTAFANTAGLPDLPLVGLPGSGVSPAGTGAPFSGLPIGQNSSPGGGAVPTGLLPTGAVPEPTTWAMLIIGFMIIGAALRRSRKTRPDVTATA